MSNPYLNDDDDDDILAPPSRPARPHGAHTLDGTPCARCGGRIHHISMPKDVPSEVQDKLSDMLDKLPPGAQDEHIIVTSATPHQHELLAGLKEFLEQAEHVNTVGPLVRAVAEVIDEYSGGEVRRRARLYSAERQLLVCHAILKTLNSLVDGIRTMNAEANKPEVTPLVEMTEKLLNEALDRLHEAQDRYRAVCAERAMDPDEELLAHGVPSNYGDLAQQTMKDWLDEGMGGLMR